MKRHYFLSSILLILVASLFVPTLAFAVTYGSSRQVSSNEDLTAGTVVVMASEKDTVRAAGVSDAPAVMGVITSAPEGSLEPGQVIIVSSGVASVLVSDVAGPVKKGDPVVVSPVDGVGMKATQEGWIIGTAQEDFETSTAATVNTTASGKPLAIKRLSVLLSVSYYSTGTAAPNSFLAATLGAAEAVAGHSVSTTRAVIALLVFSGAIILLVVLIYSATKTSITAIGRNPLASVKIGNGLVKVLVTAVGIILLTLVTVYLILR